MVHGDALSQRLWYCRRSSRSLGWCGTALISSENRSHEGLVTYPVLVCPKVAPSYERDRVTDVDLIAELNNCGFVATKGLRS